MLGDEDYALMDADDEPMDSAFDRPADVPVCSYFVSGAGCRFGEGCRFRHPREALWMRDQVVAARPAGPTAAAAAAPGAQGAPAGAQAPGSCPDAAPRGAGPARRTAPANEAQVDVAAADVLARALAFLQPGGALDSLLPLVAVTDAGEEQVAEWEQERGPAEPAAEAAGGAAATRPLPRLGQKEEEEEEAAVAPDTAAGPLQSRAGGQEGGASGAATATGSDGAGVTGSGPGGGPPVAVAAEGRAGAWEEEEDEEAEEEPAEVVLERAVVSCMAANGLWPAALEMAEAMSSEGVECGVCFEMPCKLQRQHGLAKGTGWAGLVSGQDSAKFGLLSGCAHAFCLSCIRQWRARTDVPKDTARSCPVCRAKSHLVVPCERMVRHPVRRAQVLSAYTRRLSRIPCMHFARGSGDCPFGSSCFYEHRLADGSLAPTAPPRLYYDGDGNVSGRRGLLLADFL